MYLRSREVTAHRGCGGGVCGGSSSGVCGGDDDQRWAVLVCTMERAETRKQYGKRRPEKGSEKTRERASTIQVTVEVVTKSMT